MICTKYINTHAFIKCDDNATRCAIVTLFLRKRCTISAANKKSSLHLAHQGE